MVRPDEDLPDDYEPPPGAIRYVRSIRLRLATYGLQIV